MPTPLPPTIAIIGGGFGGIATAVKLSQAGIDDFVVFEQSPAPGGTWYDNTYPGCEVDVNSQLYSFSFMPYDWSRTHAGRAELQRYAEDTVDHFGIRDRFRFGVRVEEVAWDDECVHYRVRLADGSEHEFTAVVSCVGFLTIPKYPDWPGLDAFAGPCFHTARWEHEHDLSGKTVAIVGTGSTSIQATPELAKVAKHVYVYQREPGWIVPKRSRTYSAATRRRRRRWPWIARTERLGYWLLFEVGLRGASRVGAVQNRVAHRLCLRSIGSKVPDPELREMVTPKYAFGCKRPIFDDLFYRALARDDVTLVPHAVTEVTPDAVRAADGATRPADVLILATGFQAQRYLASIRVRGKGGRDLHETWADTPQAFLGLTVPGFPNFFMLYGPNTNGGNSIIFQLERQAEATVRMIRTIRRRRSRVLDTRSGAFDRFSRWIDAQTAKGFSAATLCNNYYFSPSGRNVTQWPRGSVDYWLLTRILPAFATVSNRTATRTENNATRR